MIVWLVARPLRAASQTIPPVRRVNVPFTTAVDGNIPVPERAIFWFGEVGPTTANYVDGRVIYNNEQLYVTLHIFDRLLFYDNAPAADELTGWDAATLYLNLDGSSGSAPDANAYQFVAQVNWFESRDGGLYQAAYRGTGSGWSASDVAFTTTTGWQGKGFNDLAEDRGWNVTFKIPFSSLDLSGQPAEGTVWAMAVAVHDRDDAAGSAIPDTIWPETMVTTQPVTWGQIHLGLPVYDAPAAAPGDVVTIRQGGEGTAVPDAGVGGGTVCGGSPPFWPEWGSLNYAGSPYVNVQNQWNLGDWPCFSKYYVTFPLDALPANRAILSATLTLYQFGNSNQGGLFDPARPPQPSLIQVLTIADNWQEATLNWNNAPLPVENVARSWVDPLPAGPPWPNVPRYWDVSQAVAEAYAAGEPLRLALYSADNAMHSGKYFRSSDADAVARPTLQVLWGDDKGFAVTVDPVLRAIGPGETAVFTINVQPTNGSVSSATVATADPYADLSVSPQVQTLSSLPGTVTLSVTDRHGGAFSDSLWYTLPITVTGGTAVQETAVKLLLNGRQIYLPAIQNGG